MPSRAYTSLLLTNKSALDALDICVNALSGLYLIVTYDQDCDYKGIDFRCQCPLGLIPHCYEIKEKTYNWFCEVSMPSRAYTSLLPGRKWRDEFYPQRVNALSGLYLIVTHSQVTSFMSKYNGVNALSGLYLIVTARYYEACLAG